MRNDLAVFILSHGRADNVKTYDTLIKSGYTGKIYILIDNEDKTADEYYKRFGDKVIMFDKEGISNSDKYDKFDKFDNKKVIYFARNACREEAEKLGLTYFWQLDDDYTRFEFRYLKDEKLKHDKRINNLDAILNIMIRFLDKSKALTLCMGQGGDFIGGANSGLWKKQLSRKGMNSFLCRVDRPFNFYGRINEDVNTYTMLGNKGELIFTFAMLSLEQLRTQANAGGMTEQYLNGGTYLKTFYTIICSPQAVKISVMGVSDLRIHHKVNWKKCCPKILDEKYKKR